MPVLTGPVGSVPDPFASVGARLEEFLPVKTATDDALASNKIGEEQRPGETKQTGVM